MAAAGAAVIGAAGAGLVVTGVAAISESGQPVPFPVFHKEMAMLASRDAATPVETGTNEIAISVAVTYLIS